MREKCAEIKKHIDMILEIINSEEGDHEDYPMEENPMEGNPEGNPEGDPAMNIIIAAKKKPE
jgi:hypothetical protein